MKPNSPHLLIIIAGTSGSGKSTVGATLAQRIGYEFFDGDNFHSEENRAKIGRGEPLNDDDRGPWLKSLAALSIKNPGKKMVIACSALKRKYRQILLSDNPGTEKQIILLNVPREVLKMRMENRKGHFAKSNLIDSQLAALELPTEEGNEPNLTVLDGTRTVDELVDSIMEILQFKK